MAPRGITRFLSTLPVKPARAVTLIKLAAWCGLVGPDAAGDNIRAEVIFTPHGRTRDAAARGDLSHVGQRVGDGPLEELFWRRA